MAPSQLKSLKASLWAQGVLGPGKSKKERKRSAKERPDQRKDRNAALAEIREQFNPFEAKYLSRGPKYDASGPQESFNAVVGRPGAARAAAEESRRATLLQEMQRRRKVGGLVDRRFGEDDPTMSPEEKALARFVREKERGRRKASMFDLEDERSEEGLTHMGRSIFSKEEVREDFDGGSLKGSDYGDDAEVAGATRARKRRRLDEDEEIEEPQQSGEEYEATDRPKTKHEVMKEVIAKSKLHKYERQQAKEDDDELRAELDEGLHDIYAFLRKDPKKEAKVEPKVADPFPINPDRAAMISGKSRADADREYDARMRQMAFDVRSKPTAKTKTDEERAEEEAVRLKKLEEERLRRMAGDEEDAATPRGGDQEGDEDDMDEPHILGHGIPVRDRKELGVEDEDDFLLDDDLIASDASDDVESVTGDSSVDSEADEEDEDDQEFVGELLSAQDRKGLQLDLKKETQQRNSTEKGNGLAFTYACPLTHDEFVSITDGIAHEELHTLIQRIRALHSLKLNGGNKAKLAQFSGVLVQHIPYLASQSPNPPVVAFEALIRHAHSLAKTFPLEVGTVYRDQLAEIHKQRSLDLNPGDLLVLTGIGSTFSTSDHFHQIATPAMMTMARYLGQKIPRSISDLAKGLYLCSLCLQYQQLAKRYVPEVINCLLNSLQMLSTQKAKKPFGAYPAHESPESLRIGTPGGLDGQIPSPSFWLVDPSREIADPEIVKLSLLHSSLRLIEGCSALWTGKDSYPEIFEPFLVAFQHLRGFKLPASTKNLLKSTAKAVQSRVEAARASRKPLELHHHRPQAIKTSVPRFEETFNPNKHYDPDEARREGSKLRAEYRKERKGVLRELRRDASFVARESLREKKAADKAYEDKFRKLVASIQGEEGREANAYEREKRLRKSKR